MQNATVEGSDPLSGESLPSTSLIICSRNRPEMFQETVASILKGSELPNELILVDQSDVPHPALSQLESFGSCQIHYIKTETIGLSVARNIGISRARGAILVFTDDDVFVIPEWFGTLVRALVRGGKNTAVTGQVRMSDPEKPGGFQLAVKLNRDPAVYAGRIGIDVLKPLNMAMYRMAFEQVGCFDVRLGTGSRFPSSEDNDFGFRLLEAGYQILYIPEAAVIHRAWRSGHDFYALNWSYGRGQGAYYAKHFRLRDLYMLKRMLGEYTRFFLELPRKLAKKEIFPIIGDGIFLLGILSGCIEWLVTWPEEPAAQ